MLSCLHLKKNIFVWKEMSMLSEGMSMRWFTYIKKISKTSLLLDGFSSITNFLLFQESVFEVMLISSILNKTGNTEVLTDITVHFVFWSRGFFPPFLPFCNIHMPSVLFSSGMCCFHKRKAAYYASRKPQVPLAQLLPRRIYTFLFKITKSSPIPEKRM